MAGGIPSVENITDPPHESHKPTHVLLPIAIRAETEWSGESIRAGRASEREYGASRSKAVIMSSDVAASLAALTHLMQDPHTGVWWRGTKLICQGLGRDFVGYSVRSTSYLR